MALSIFVGRTQQISCDICNFVNLELKWRFSQPLWSKPSKLCFVRTVFNNKRIILFNLVELSPEFSQIGQHPRQPSIKRYSARFRRITFYYPHANHCTCHTSGFVLLFRNKFFVVSLPGWTGQFILQISCLTLRTYFWVTVKKLANQRYEKLCLDCAWCWTLETI